MNSDLIKFRVFDHKNKVMYPHGAPDLKMGGIFASRKLGKIDSYFEEGRAELIPFSGKHDKEGTEIYEGDILDWSGQKKKIVVVFDTGSYYARYHDGSPVQSVSPEVKAFNPVWDAHTRVIGTIYE